MEENIKVDKDYKEGFNQGYELASELGLKPDILKDVYAGNNRMQAMKDGMEQYQKDTLDKAKTQNKQDIIPPLDMDSLDDNHIDLTPDKADKSKGFDMDL